MVSSANRDVFISSFFVHVPFISFSCFIVLEKASSPMLRRGGESGDPCLLILGEKRSVCPHCTCRQQQVLVGVHYQVVVAPSVFSFLRVLVMWVLNFIRWLFCIKWYGTVIFLLQPAHMVDYYIDWLEYWTSLVSLKSTPLVHDGV